MPSTEGMKFSLQTSELMKMKLEANLSQIHINQLSEALESRNFDKFAEITMKESN